MQYGRLQGLVVRPGGGLVGLGRSTDEVEGPRGVLAVFTDRGQFDATFNGGEPVLTSFRSDGLCTDGVANADGSIISVGLTMSVPGVIPNSYVARYLADGWIDPVLGINEFNTFLVEPGTRGVVFQRNGRLTVSASYDPTTNYDFHGEVFQVLT